MLILHVYIGTEVQVPTDYTLNLEAPATYQDVITTFIQMGGQSGQIYGIHGEIVKYEDPIKLLELNYIIPPEPYSTIYVRDLHGKLHRITYSENGTLQDIYNQVQALGLGRNVRLVLQIEDNLDRPWLGETTGPRDPPPDNLGSDISFLLSQDSKKAVPTLLRGRKFPLATAVRDLQLHPDRVFHLVKYHYAFMCRD